MSIYTRDEITIRQMELADRIYDQVTSADYEDIEISKAIAHMKKLEALRMEIDRDLYSRSEEGVSDD